jgi:hypothetical protein
MTTLALSALPFEQVEDRVKLVSLSVKIVQGRNAVRVWLCKLHLTVSLHEIASIQDQLISELNNGVVCHSTPHQLMDIAAKVNELVTMSKTQLAQAQEINFPTWRGYLHKISEQVERLDSLAETFELSASAEFTAYVDELIDGASKSGNEPVESWRDFVASLHN